MFDPDEHDIDDWSEIEASIRALRPEAVPFTGLVRHRIVESLGEFCRQREEETQRIPKSLLLKQCDLISKRAAELGRCLEVTRGRGAKYCLLQDDGSPTDEWISVRRILHILESIDCGEQDFARMIGKFHEHDPVPLRKRLGVGLFLLGEQAFGLSSKHTTPPDRGAGKPPTGELFSFVAEVMKQVGDQVEPTTLEQWSRDAQAWKREAEEAEQARKVARAELFAQIHGVGCPVPDEDAGCGTYIVHGDAPPFLRGRHHRDWLRLDRDCERDRDWMCLDEDDD